MLDVMMKYSLILLFRNDRVYNYFSGLFEEDIWYEISREFNYE